MPDPQLGDVIPFPPRSFAWGIRLPSFISANRPCLFLSAAPHWRPELITEGGAMVLGSGICWFSSVSGSSGLEMGFGGPGESQRRGIWNPRDYFAEGETEAQRVDAARQGWFIRMHKVFVGQWCLKLYPKHPLFHSLPVVLAVFLFLRV